MLSEVTGGSVGIDFVMIIGRLAYIIQGLYGDIDFQHKIMVYPVSAHWR